MTDTIRPQKSRRASYISYKRAEAVRAGFMAGFSAAAGNGADPSDVETAFIRAFPREAAIYLSATR